MYHLEYGLQGAGFLEYSWLIFTATTLIVLSGYYLYKLILKMEKDKTAQTINSFSLLPIFFVSLILNPAIIDLYNVQNYPSIFTEKSNVQTKRYFYDYYRKPAINLSESRKKNIVFIYAESLEYTYFDQSIFPGLIKGLREIESKSTFFTNIKQVDSTGWTIAGMTASQCGLPLNTPSYGNSVKSMGIFLPLAVCLGDLLSDVGYDLNYMGGASLEFAGKGKFYKSHGFSDVSGRDELSLHLEDKKYQSWWGLYDDSLLKLVYSRFIELSEAGGKFGLFTLTLDTHEPSSDISKSCKGREYKDGSNSSLNAVSCSDYLISNLIKKIVESPYADETIVVIASDHLARNNKAIDYLKKRERNNLFMIFDPSKINPKEIKVLGSTLDVGATLLPFLGYKGEIGLGRNLLNSQELSGDRLSIHSNLTRWKKPIAKFWDYPIIKSHLEINIDNEFVRIDNRKFRMPILINLNEKLESSLFFQIKNMDQGKHKTLVQRRKKLSENQYFLLIDECKNARKLDRTLARKGFCLLSGQGRRYTKIATINESVTYTTNEIRQLLKITNNFMAPEVANAASEGNNKTDTNSFESQDSK